MECSEDLINTYRKKICEFLKNYEGEPIVIDGVPFDILQKVLFDKDQFGSSYPFNSEILEVIEKIDFRNVCFDDMKISRIDFSHLKNVSLNPYNITFPTNDFPIEEYCNFFNVYFTKEIVISDRLAYMSFKGSRNAQLSIKHLYRPLLIKSVDFCDATFNNPIPDHAEIFYCNFEGSHGAIINLDKAHVKDTVLYDATIYGNIDLGCDGIFMDPSINAMKRVYGDTINVPTLVRKKDFN